MDAGLAAKLTGCQPMRDGVPTGRLRTKQRSRSTPCPSQGLPNRWDTWRWSSETGWQIRQLQKAVRQLRQLAGIDPSEVPPLYLRLGECHLVHKRVDTTYRSAGLSVTNGPVMSDPCASKRKWPWCELCTQVSHVILNVGINGAEKTHPDLSRR